MPALETLKQFDLRNANVTLWIFKRKARWVATTEELNEALIDAIVAARDRVDEVLEYSVLAQNNEHSCLSIALADTSAADIVAETDGPIVQKQATENRHLQNASFYAVRFVADDDAIIAVRKAESQWRAKKVRSAIPAVFREQRLGLDVDPGYNISKAFDFYIVGDTILIANKAHFESVLQYKTGHRDEFTALCGEAEFTGLFTDLAPLVAFVGDNKIRLRRALAIRQKGHYRNNIFLQNLRNLHQQYGLNLQFDDAGRIVPTPETCGDIVTALLDHRLFSQFSQQIYDVQDAARVPVAGA